MKQTLGVQPHGEAGDRRYVVRPCAASVKWARGAYPLEDGLIEVEWEAEADRVTINVACPSNITVAVEPGGDLAGKEQRIRVNGRTRTQTGDDG
jgi:hypothetical protein